MGINIGNNNKINNSIISEESRMKNEKKKNIFEKHPLIFSFLISLFAGFILLFSFWGKIVEWIENIFIGG